MQFAYSDMGKLTESSFLDADTLEVLKDGLEAAKDPGFKAYKWFECLCATLFSAGAGPVLSPSICYVNGMYNDAYLRLTEDSLQFSQPTPSCCVLARTNRVVRYDQITDVTVEDDCCMQLFGIKQLIVQTAGTGGVGPAANLAGVQAKFLADPETWKSMILHAQQLGKEMSAPGAQGMTRNVGSSAAKLLKGRLERLAELQKLRVLSESQVQGIRTAVLLHEVDFTAKLLGLTHLRDSGKLDPGILVEAVQKVLSIYAAL